MTIPHPIIFIRHGATQWNEDGRYQGTTETCLTSVGRQQAVQNAQLIAKSEIPLDELKLISSPLLRAQQTANIIIQSLNLKDSQISTDERLRELGVGRWQGLNSQQVKDNFYEERKSRKHDRWNFKPLGGESLEQRSGEVLALLQSLSPTTLIITHAGILRIIHYLVFAEPKQEAAALSIPHDGLLIWKGAISHTS